jgi:hypothetical protein
MNKRNSTQSVKGSLDGELSAIVTLRCQPMRDPYAEKRELVQCDLENES